MRNMITWIKITNFRVWIGTLCLLSVGFIAVGVLRLSHQSRSLCELGMMTNLPGDESLTDKQLEEFSNFIDGHVGMPKREVADFFRLDTPEETSALWPGGCPHEKQYSLPNCTTTPRQKIVFIKTHKCGSSTLSALILRYAYEKDLSVSLPRFDSGHIGWPSPYRPYYVYGYWTAQLPFHVLAHHSVYDRCYVRKDFPKRHYVYVSILREPWKQFVSSARFFMIPYVKETEDNLLFEILKSPERYGKEFYWEYNRVTLGKSSYLGFNPMSRDLGFPLSQARNQTAIDLFIQRLDKDFDLIVILEYFYESLVILKRLMCWELRDLLYVVVNSGPSTLSSESQRKVTGENVTVAMKMRHRQLSNVDYQLYRYFKKKFLKIRDEQDKTFPDEVDILTKMIQEINEYCTKLKMRTPLIFEKNRFSEAITIVRRDCDKLKLMPEDFTLPMKYRMTVRQETTLKKHWPYDEVPPI